MVGALVLLQDAGPLLPGRLGHPGAHERPNTMKNDALTGRHSGV